MNIWKLFRFPFYSPEDMGGAPGGGGGDLDQDLRDLADEDDDNEDADDPDADRDSDKRDRGKAHRNRDVDDLKDPDDTDDDTDNDDDKEDDADEEDEDEKDGDDADDDDGDEEDEEDEDSDKDDDEKPKRVVGRPTTDDMKKSGIYKTMPGLRGVYHREAEYSEVFADPEEARQAAVESASFRKLATTLNEGDPELLLTELKKSSPEAFEKVAKAFIPSALKMDSRLYAEFATPFIEDLLHNAMKFAEREGDTQEAKNLRAAVKYVNRFAFGTYDVKDVTKRPATGEKHPAEIQLEKERDDRRKAEAQSASDDINTRLMRSVRGMITEGLPSELRPFVRNALTREIEAKLGELLEADKTFQSRQRGLWSRAVTAGYSEQSKRAMVDGHVNKVRSIIREVKAQALKEAGIRAKKNIDKDTDKDTTLKPKKKVFKGNAKKSSDRRGGTVLDSSKIDYRRTTDEDILSDDPKRITFKSR